jgi:DNA-binding NtrC family response regulator
MSMAANRHWEAGGNRGRPILKVLLIDEDRARAARIMLVAGALGVFVRLLPAPDGQDSSIALVALDTPAGLRNLRELKSMSVKAFGYAAGAGGWPIQRRCEALLAGAAALLDSIGRDFDEELRGHLEQALSQEQRRDEAREHARAALLRLGIVGQSAAMVEIFQSVLRIAGLSQLPVLLTGETGTGKEMFARALHQLDPKRAKGPMVAVNCAAIAAGVAESELFGHRRGAFTGAEQDRKGLFRAADRGVLFLDEVNELDPGLQAKLLRVLQDGRLTAVGDDREVAVDVRIIAATNRDLPELVRQGSFRADLYHRLNVLTLSIPPLRGRPEDVAPLVDHFIRKHQASAGAAAGGASEEFLEALRRHELPGNVRQLENIIRWVLANREGGGPLCLRDLPADVLNGLAPHADLDPPPSAPPAAERSYFEALLDLHESNLARAVEHCERLLLEAALQRAQGNQTKAAQMVGITPRSVYNKLRKYRAAS